MRYPASEKLEIIRLVEESHLSARLTLAKLGIPRTTFYRWYQRGGIKPRQVHARDLSTMIGAPESSTFTCARVETTATIGSTFSYEPLGRQLTIKKALTACEAEN